MSVWGAGRLCFTNLNRKYLKQNYSFLRKLQPQCFMFKRNSSETTTEIKKQFDKTFFEVVSHRRGEAKRSIIVQVHSSQSHDELFTYCSQFGEIKNMCHYSAGPDNSHFIIIEFHSDSVVQSVFSNSCHLSDEELQAIPVVSPFLWFRANNKRRSKTNSEKTSPFPIESGINIIDEEKLNKLLIKSNNITEQMTTLYNATRLSDTGTRIRFLAARQIEMALSGMFPNITAVPFGSSVNGFGKEGCDLDLVVRADSEKKETNRLVFHSKATLWNARSQTQRHMTTIADILQLFLPGCTNIRKILPARVPIIKYNQDLTGLEIDLSMTNMSGVYMSDLLYTISSIDQRVRPLVFTVKKWAQLTGLTNQSPGRWITNFSLTLLVLAFLQKVKILPSINLLYRLAELNDKAVTEDGIDCTFLHDLSKLPASEVNNDSLESLLFQFFEYYSVFDFESKAVSLNDGKAIIKPEYSPLYIVNPLEKHLNVSKNVSGEELDRLSIEFRNAAFKLSDVSPKKDSKWGILEFESQSNIRKDIFFTAPFKKQHERLIDLTNVFDDPKNEPEFKNKRIENEVQQIKTQTKKIIGNLETSSKRKKLHRKR